MSHYLQLLPLSSTKLQLLKPKWRLCWGKRPLGQFNIAKEITTVIGVLKGQFELTQICVLRRQQRHLSS